MRLRLALLLALTSCATPAAPRPATPGAGLAPELAGPTTLSPRGQALWREHLAASTGPGLQPACAPRRYVPAGEPRGLVLAFHGYTGCPDQFDGLGPALAEAGYEVLAPLLPGHGRVQPPHAAEAKLVDDVADLPGREDWQRYQQFAAAWAEALGEARGEHAVVGLSLGGTVASLTVAARPQAVDRALVVVPFFSLSNTFVKTVLGLAAGLDALLQANPIDPTEAHWGPSCEEERRAGRGGYCSFRVTHVAAVQLAGREARRALLQAARLPRLQLAVVDQDPAVDSALAVETWGALAARTEAGRCTYARSVPHSFVAPHDNPRLAKPWLAPFTSAAVGFLAGGRPFAPGACPGSPAE